MTSSKELYSKQPKNNPMYGTKASIETRRKMSESQKARNYQYSEDQFKAMSERVSGDKNPAKRKDVQRKMALSRLKISEEYITVITNKWDQYKKIMTIKTFTEKERLRNRRTLRYLLNYRDKYLK